MDRPVRLTETAAPRDAVGVHAPWILRNELAGEAEVNELAGEAEVNELAGEAEVNELAGEAEVFGHVVGGEPQEARVVG
ncbi:hypothetical protein [Streptomyces sp. bgisy034]|uniref:hypothetical protein n=1 Tax=Streptomyces sp. bgisy034 TaxID=3413774 RepID=UPI003EB83D2F